MLSNNENFKLCSECGGKCCNNYGCYHHPNDFKELSVNYLKPLIERGNISIDSYDRSGSEKDKRLTEQPRTLFLRARHVDAPVVDFSFGGVCKMLVNNRCSYSWEERPYGGKRLAPVSEGVCINDYNKQECALDWYPYQEILEELRVYFKEKDTEEMKNNILKLSKEVKEFLDKDLDDKTVSLAENLIIKYFTSVGTSLMVDVGLPKLEVRELRNNIAILHNKIEDYTNSKNKVKMINCFGVQE